MRRPRPRPPAAPAGSAPGSVRRAPRHVVGSSVVTWTSGWPRSTAVLPALDQVRHRRRRPRTAPTADAAELAAIAPRGNGWRSGASGRGPGAVDDPAPTSADWMLCHGDQLDEGLSFDVVVDPRSGRPGDGRAGHGLDRRPALHRPDARAGRARRAHPRPRAPTWARSPWPRPLPARTRVAVEASPENVALLRASVARNGFRERAGRPRGGLRRARAEPVPSPRALGPGGHRRPTTPTGRSPSPPSPSRTWCNELGWRPAGLRQDRRRGLGERAVMAGMRQLLGTPHGAARCSTSAMATRWLSRGPRRGADGRGGRPRVHQLPGRPAAAWCGSTPATMQPQTLVDYLAVKRPPTLLLEGWRSSNDDGLDERVDRIVADCRHANPAPPGPTWPGPWPPGQTGRCRPPRRRGGARRAAATQTTSERPEVRRGASVGAARPRRS